MNIKVAYSTKEKVEEIAEEIGKELADFDAKAVIFFASSKSIQAPNLQQSD